MGWRKEWKQGPGWEQVGELRFERTRAELGCQQWPLRGKTAVRGTEEQEVTDRTWRGNGHEGKEDSRRSFQGAQCG